MKICNDVTKNDILYYFVKRKNANLDMFKSKTIITLHDSESLYQIDIKNLIMLVILYSTIKILPKIQYATDVPWPFWAGLRIKLCKYSNLFIWFNSCSVTCNVVLSCTVDTFWLLCNMRLSWHYDRIRLSNKYLERCLWRFEADNFSCQGSTEMVFLLKKQPPKLLNKKG